MKPDSLLEIISFLLPIAAASGWFAAAKHYRRRPKSDGADRLTRTCLRSTDFLLAEKPEKAIDAFVDTLEEDCDTVETHIALGNLFRRKGEMERAISIHQGLMGKPALHAEHRVRVLFELGMDYMRAGLLDRAEKTFTGLTQDRIHREPALQQLLQIYQHEREWSKALECTRAIGMLGKIQRGESVAQFHCELAEEALAAGQAERAMGHVQTALQQDDACVRASLQKARIECSRKNYGLALHTLKNIEKQNSAYVVEMIGPLRECYDYLGDAKEQVLYFQYLFDKYHPEAVMLILAELINQSDGTEQAIAFLSGALAKQPSIKGMSHLIALHKCRARADCHSTLAELERLSVQLSTEKMCYQCTHCGFRGAELHWQCPSCHHWETIKPMACALNAL